VEKSIVVVVLGFSYSLHFQKHTMVECEKTELLEHVSNELDYDNDTANNVPIIDLMHTDHDEIVKQIAYACRTAGFFHVIHHGIAPELMQEFRYQCRLYFTQLDISIKEQYRRNEKNARGYFDNELTKQRRDWKYALDVGVPGSRRWDVADDDRKNGCLDGYNQLPTDDELLGFRSTVIAYFDACSDLSHRLTILMTDGMKVKYSDSTTEGCLPLQSIHNLGMDIIDDLQKNHTSYLRMNYYPPCPNDVALQESESNDGVPPLGISPHRDAGFLTVLLQDDDCYSLQVLETSNERDSTGITQQKWRTVQPIKGGLTINTGDMAQIWSNGIYKAPLHRVLTHPNKERYSAPFFYNPGYATWIQPITLRTDSVMKSRRCADGNAELNDNTTLQYHPCLWGYFRAVRFAGDLTDVGVEIQVEDFRQQSPEKSKHLSKQQIFSEQACFNEPFSVDRFRHLLVE
jgi:isopenicillin N synthase-like dioxygenase